jgi:hypothetical protein
MTEPSTSERGTPYDAAPAATPRPEKTSVWEDFIDILYNPSAVYARRENGSVWLPTIVIALLIGGIFLATYGVLEPVMDAEFRRGMQAAMEANPQLTEEQMRQGQAFTSVIARVMAFISIPLAVFFVGLTLWLVGKLFDAKQTLHAAWVVAAYAYVPKVLEAVLSGVQGMLLDPAQLDGRFRLTLGIGRFLDPDTTSPALLALLGRVDVFTIWVTVLLAIGLSVTGKIPRARAAVAAAIVWVIGALPTVLPALRQG